MMNDRTASAPHDPAVRSRFAGALPSGATTLGRAPGRANLIGEHTDYNEGFVLPVALELDTVVGGLVAENVTLTSLDEPGTVQVDLRDGSGPTEGWGRYVTAVVRVLREEGLALRGVDGVVASDVPVGTGLSSSAAIEVAVALAVLAEPIDAVRLAQLCQRAENVHVGVMSGIMDQLASTAARDGHALFIDCRTLALDHVPVPEDLRILVIDSGQRRELSGGDYNRRREECEDAARLLGVPSLRDVADVGDIERLSDPLRARARHVVSENARTLATVDALRRDDRAALGELFAASHASLATDFEVSTAELDLLVTIARATPGVVGARMTGAGFGGCTVNLVEADAAEDAARAIVADYARRSDRAPRWWVSRAAPGAMELAAASD
jgi:galactokinase